MSEMHSANLGRGSSIRPIPFGILTAASIECVVSLDWDCPRGLSLTSRIRSAGIEVLCGMHSSELKDVTPIILNAESRWDPMIATRLGSLPKGRQGHLVYFVVEKNHAVNEACLEATSRQDEFGLILVNLGYNYLKEVVV